MPSTPILHLALAADFAAQSGQPDYLPPAFAQDGFIHCTVQAEILLDIANRFYRATPGDFVVLVIDPARVTAALRFEGPLPPPPPGSPLENILFPHIYGPLNRAAILEVRPARRAADGSFIQL